VKSKAILPQRHRERRGKANEELKVKVQRNTPEFTAVNAIILARCFSAWTEKTIKIVYSKTITEAQRHEVT
jgi:hypothetical protein